MITDGIDISCYGCGVCAVACPQNAITMTLSSEGFWVPVISRKSCVDCSICENVCACMDTKSSTPADRLQTVPAYAVVNKDEEIRRFSTSGGAGYAIASRLREEGYCLVGVKYDNERNIACHFVTNDLEEFKQTMNSKYIPSYTVNGFSGLMDGQKYAVFGTPCQIDSLHRWARLRKKENNFIFVDLFCHGVPSYLHWNAYLKYHLHEDEKLLSPIFRDKRNGWHRYTMSLKTNKRLVSKTVQSNDLFQNIFLGNYSLNRLCYHCIYREDNSAADIRMGDLWGGKYAGNEEGITGVLALTEKGRSVMENISAYCDVYDEQKSVVLAGQLHQDLSVPLSREKLLNGFREGKSISLLYLRYASRMWQKNLIPYTVKCLIKQLIYIQRKR